MCRDISVRQSVGQPLLEKLKTFLFEFGQIVQQCQEVRCLNDKRCGRAVNISLHIKDAIRDMVGDSHHKKAVRRRFKGVVLHRLDGLILGGEVCVGALLFGSAYGIHIRGQGLLR